MYSTRELLHQINHFILFTKHWRTQVASVAMRCRMANKSVAASGKRQWKSHGNRLSHLCLNALPVANGS